MDFSSFFLTIFSLIESFHSSKVHGLVPGGVKFTKRGSHTVLMIHLLTAEGMQLHIA